MESLCRAFNNISSKVGVLHPDVEWSKTGKLIWDYLRFITEYPLHLPTFYFGVPGWVRWTCRTKVVSQCDTEHELSEVESIQFPKPATLRTGSMTSFLDPLPNWEVYPLDDYKSFNISMRNGPTRCQKKAFDDLYEMVACLHSIQTHASSLLFASQKFRHLMHAYANPWISSWVFARFRQMKHQKKALDELYETISARHYGPSNLCTTTAICTPKFPPAWWKNTQIL